MFASTLCPDYRFGFYRAHVLLNFGPFAGQAKLENLRESQRLLLMESFVSSVCCRSCLCLCARMRVPACGGKVVGR